MKDIIKLNDELFYTRYKLNDIEKTKEIWEYIKNNPKILRESVKQTKGKFNNDTLVATIIKYNIKKSSSTPVYLFIVCP